MNKVDLIKLQKYSLFTIKIDGKLRDQIINSNINSLNKFIKSNLKKNLIVFVNEDQFDK